MATGSSTRLPSKRCCCCWIAPTLFRPPRGLSASCATTTGRLGTSSLGGATAAAAEGLCTAFLCSRWASNLDLNLNLPNARDRSPTARFCSRTRHRTSDPLATRWMMIAERMRCFWRWNFSSSSVNRSARRTRRPRNTACTFMVATVTSKGLIFGTGGDGLAGRAWTSGSSSGSTNSSSGGWFTSTIVFWRIGIGVGLHTARSPW